MLIKQPMTIHMIKMLENEILLKTVYSKKKTKTFSCFYLEKSKSSVKYYKVMFIGSSGVFSNYLDNYHIIPSKRRAQRRCTSSDNKHACTYTINIQTKVKL